MVGKTNKTHWIGTTNAITQFNVLSQMEKLLENKFSLETIRRDFCDLFKRAVRVPYLGIWYHIRVPYSVQRNGDVVKKIAKEN